MRLFVLERDDKRLHRGIVEILIDQVNRPKHCEISIVVISELSGTQSKRGTPIFITTVQVLIGFVRGVSIADFFSF